MTKNEHHITVIAGEKVKLQRKYSYLLTEHKKRRIIVNDIITPSLLRFIKQMTVSCNWNCFSILFGIRVTDVRM
jgi:hypothetical protein